MKYSVILTKELVQRFREIGSQRLEENPKVIAKYDLSKNRISLYMIEFNEETEQFYGYKVIHSRGSETTKISGPRAFQRTSMEHLIPKRKDQKFDPFYLRRDADFKEQPIGDLFPQLQPQNKG